MKVYLDDERIAPNGHGNSTHDNETHHARFPLLNPLPQAGEEANESLREFHVKGWVQVRWPDEAIKLLQTGTVTHLSLDHDLGDDQRGTGYDVLIWIEQEIALNKFTPPIKIEVHSANLPAHKRMLAAIDSILRMNISTVTPL